MSTAAETKPEGAAAPAQPATQSLLTQEPAPAKPAQADASPAKPAAQAAAPAAEVYEVKAPEGHDLDGEVLKTYTDTAKELKLPREAAQSMLDKLLPVLQARAEARMTAEREQWANLSRTDKEFGGEKLMPSLAAAQKFLNAYGTPALNEWLRDSGAGNHPELIRLLARASAAITPDPVVTGAERATGAASDDFASLAERIYPKK